jgi:hypothetical protein
MPRRRRTLIAFLAACVFLFAQLAVAAYACPGSSQQEAAAAAERPPCAELDTELSNLCQKHCHGSEQSQAASPVPAAFVPAFIATIARSPETVRVERSQPSSSRHATSPPLTIRNCCFRI